IRSEPVAVGDIPHALASRFLVPHRIPRALADGLSFPLTHRRHDVDYEPTRCRAGVQRLSNRNQRHAALLKSFEQFGQVLHAACEPVELGDDHRLPLRSSTSVSSRSMPGRFRSLADSPPSTISSTISVPGTVAMARIFASCASSETPLSALLVCG